MLTRRAQVRHLVAWLPVVRWLTAALLWLVVAIVWLFPHLDVPLRESAWLGLGAAICRTAVAVIGRGGRSVSPTLYGLCWSVEAALLTSLLDITGGLFNPFLVMYVTYVWIATATLSPAWGVVVAIVSAAGFGWLILDHVQAEMAEHHRLNDFPTHLFTMWMCGAGLAELVGHYLARARTTFALQQQEVDAARERARASEHLAALTTLAAGAAHELSTPLATIAVAARELERNAAHLAVRLSSAVALKDDASLIRTEVDRCRTILDSMSGRAPGDVGSLSHSIRPIEIATLVRERLPGDQQARLNIDVTADLIAPAAGAIEVVQAIGALLKNAFEASAPTDVVSLRFTAHASMLRISVHDRGAGLTAAARQRAGEPFYTTKEPGRGMGLGLFLTRTFAERAGGSFHLETVDGTTAVLELPLAASEAGAA